MAYIRKRGGSHQLIETYREDGKVRQRILANLGPTDSLPEAVRHFTDEIARMQQRGVAKQRLKEARQNLAVLKSLSPTAAGDEDEGDDAQTIWSRGVLNRAEIAAGDALYEDWRHYIVSEQHVKAAKRTARAWMKLAAYLARLKQRQK